MAEALLPESMPEVGEAAELTIDASSRHPTLAPPKPSLSVLVEPLVQEPSLVDSVVMAETEEILRLEAGCLLSVVEEAAVQSILLLLQAVEEEESSRQAHKLRLSVLAALAVLLCPLR